MRDDEMRIVIRAADAPDDHARLIPATTFKRAINAILGALNAADRELHGKKYRGSFFISHLAMGSNELGVCEQRRSASPSLRPAIDLFEECAALVYHSEYNRAAQFPKLAQSLVKIGRSIDPEYPQTATFFDRDIPLDAFFAKQAETLGSLISSDPVKFPYFVGNSIGSFDGRLESLDYRGATWKGRLILPGGGAQIECVFDRSKGEDEFNQFGNKRVSLTGRAIYTGCSQLPERIEVISIREVPLAEEAREIRGSLTGKHYFVGWDIERKNLQ